MKENTCFKGPPKCYHLILTNYKYNFQNTIALTTGFLDLHKMTVTILKTEYIKADSIQIQYRNYRNFDPILFREEIKNNQNNDIMSGNNYNDFQNNICNVLDKYAPVKKKFLRANDSPFYDEIFKKNDNE